LDLVGWKIEWEFLLEAADDKVRREDDFYFTSYVLSANLVIGALITAAADWWLVSNHFSRPIWILLLIAMAVFAIDAVCLRSCIVKNSRTLLKEARDEKMREISAAP
jgi:hypothetical protein